MPKYYYHNYRSIDESIEKKNFPFTKTAKIKRTVDINMLLNRIKLEKKNQITQKIFYYGLIISLVCLMGTFIAFIR